MDFHLYICIFSGVGELNMEHNNKKHPISHIVGFILSLVMTFVAIGVALHTPLPKTVIMTVIGILAFMQAGMQLFMFMHVNESENKKVQVGNIIYSLLMALTIIIGSIACVHAG